VDRINTKKRFCDLQEDFKRLIENNPRQFKVVKARIEGRTLQDIGNELGLTRERIRQIEKEFYKKFRKMLTQHCAFNLLKSLSQKEKRSLVSDEQIIRYMPKYGELFVLCLKNSRCIRCIEPVS